MPLGPILDQVAFSLQEGITIMLQQQIQTLKNDSAQLEIFAQELKKEGKVDLANKITAKRDYLETYISSFEGQLVNA